MKHKRSHRIVTALVPASVVVAGSLGSHKGGQIGLLHAHSPLRLVGTGTAEEVLDERCRLVLGGAVVLVRDGEVDERVKVSLPLFGSDFVGTPSGGDRSDPDVVEHPGDRLSRRLGEDPASKRRDPRDNRIVALAPATTIPTVRNPPKPVGEPDLRRREEPREGHLHGHASVSKRPSRCDAPGRSSSRAPRCRRRSRPSTLRSSRSAAARFRPRFPSAARPRRRP